MVTAKRIPLESTWQLPGPPLIISPNPWLIHSLALQFGMLSGVVDPIVLQTLNSLLPIPLPFFCHFFSALSFRRPKTERA